MALKKTHTQYNIQHTYISIEHRLSSVRVYPHSMHRNTKANETNSFSKIKFYRTKRRNEWKEGKKAGDRIKKVITKAIRRERKKAKSRITTY